MRVEVIDRPDTPTVDIDTLLSEGQERGKFAPLSIDTIQRTLGDAIKSARVSGAGLVDKFVDATKVAVADAFQLLHLWGRKDGHMTEAQVRRAADCTRDETSFPGRNLAAVVSGLTLSAQDGSLSEQRSLERFAGRLLSRGLAEGSAGIENLLSEN